MKRSLTSINGVIKVDVSLPKAEAVVTFDDAKTTIDTLTGAMAKGGFPSKLKQ